MPTWGRFHKISKAKGLESFQVGEHIHVPGWWPSSTGTGVPALGTLRDQAPRSSPPGCPTVSFLISFNELLNLFPWVLWAPPANLSNLRSPWEPVICSQAGEQLWVTWGPTICDWHLNGRQFCTTEPLTGAICCYLQVGGVRTQCRTLSWGQRTAWCRNSHTFDVRRVVSETQVNLFVFPTQIPTLSIT